MSKYVNPKGNQLVRPYRRRCPLRDLLYPDLHDMTVGGALI